MFETVISGGTVVSEGHTSRADVGVRDGKIAAIASPGGLEDDAETVVDATDRLVFPGFVDSHVHVNLRLGEYTTTDDVRDLTRAAAFGGNTTVIPFAIPDADETPLDALDRRRDEARNEAYVDYSFHGCLTETTDEHLRQIPQLIENGATSIKAFMVYADRLKLDHGQLRAVMRRTSEAGGSMLVHAEDDDIIGFLVERQIRRGETDFTKHGPTHPPVSETAALWTVSELVADTDCPTLLVHTSTEGTGDVLGRVDARGLPIVAETCPHYVALSDEVYARGDGENFVCSPPVRAATHRRAMWNLVTDGSIGVVNSDHCGYTTSQKRRHRDDITRMPNGLPGVETTAPILYTNGVATGELSLQRFVALLSTNVARAFGLYPQKGTISVGTDADLVVFDPNATWTIDPETLHMATDYSPFEGTTVEGKVESVFVRGDPVVDDGLTESAGHGEYLRREPVSEEVYEEL